MPDYTLPLTILCILALFIIGTGIDISFALGDIATELRKAREEKNEKTGS